jgi:hypothetical protein
LARIGGSLSQEYTPFAEMAQGVAENGLGYIATKSVSYVAEKSGKSWSCVLWLLIPILIIGGIGYYLISENKKKVEEQRKIEEDKKTETFR